MLEFVTSQKGTRKLVVQGYLFTKHSDGSDGKIFWRCENRTCKARVHTQENQIVHEVETHNHTVTHGKVEVERARASMKRRGGTTEETTRLIVQNELMNVPVSAAHLFPKRTTLAQDVRRHRQKIGPNDQEDIMKYSLTQGNRPFIRIRTDDMIIFAADEDLEFLSRCDHWFADGTFRVSPDGYDQLYTIHGFLNGEIFPIVYALLSSRTEQAYRHLFQEIQTLKAGLNPEYTMVTDYNNRNQIAYLAHIARVLNINVV